MNRIYRLVFNHATGQMQVASELTSTHSASAAATGGARRRSSLSAAMLVALGLSAASLPSAFAAVYDFTAHETVTDTRGYIDGFRVGPNGKVLVDLRDGGKLTSNGPVSFGTAAGSNSELRLYGPTSALTVNGAVVRVGEAGTGALRLYNGAQTTMGSTLSLGYLAGGTGIVQVDDAGSLLTARQLLVGREGVGYLTVTKGARVETTLAAPPVGNSFAMSIGNAAGSVGTVNVVSGGELLVRDNELRVGEAGKGALFVNSGSVNVGRNLVIGAAGTGEGKVEVRNKGSVAAQLISVGEAQNAVGSLLASGAGTTITTDALRVSGNGNGLLRVEEGAQVAVAGNVTAEDNQGLPSTEARTGRIEVTGPGSLLSGDRVISSTQLLVENGGEIRSNSARIRDSLSASGTATLTGAGSRWTNQGELDIRTGVNVLDGARINTGTLLVSGGSNTMTFAIKVVDEQVRVSGAGSVIEATGDITVGSHLVGEPFGFLNLANGGRVEAGGDLVLGTSGFVVLGGGFDTWSVADGSPVWATAESAGLPGSADIVMQGGGSALVLNHTDEITLGNTLRGSGGRIANVAGTTTLNGDLADFSGTVDVSGGTLRIDGDMYTGENLAPGSQSPVQWSQVSGGTLVLNGSAGFNRTINYGNESKVERSSLLVIRDGGVLAGNATIGGAEVHNGGVLSPGDGGIGTINIEGNLYFNTGGVTADSVARKAFYDVDLLGNGQSDFIKVTGTAFIGKGAGLGGIAGATGVRVTGLDPGASYQNGHTYTILNAAEGLKGGFDDAISNSAFITPTLTQTGNDVLLTIAVNAPVTPVDPVPPVDPGIPVTPVAPVDPGTPVTPGTPGVTPPIVFGAVAVTGNQRATAAALDSLQQSGDALALYNGLLMLDEAGALVAFDDLGGELHASKRALLLDDRFLREGISQRLRPTPDTKLDGSSVWVAGSGASKRQDGDGTASRTQETRQGLIVGYDWTFGDRWTVGVAGGPESLRQQIRDRGAITEVDAVHGGLYAGFRGEQAWINGGASYADYALETRRELGAGTSWEQTLDSRHDAHAVSAFAEGGWDIQLDALTLTPYLAVAYTRLSSDAAVETGGTAALSVSSSKDEAWTTTAGIRAAWDISGGETDGARLEAGLAWQNAAGELRADSRNRFVAGSDSFTVSGLPLARNVGIAELGVSVNTSDNSRLSMFAQGRAGDGQREVGAQLNWNVAF